MAIIPSGPIRMRCTTPSPSSSRPPDELRAAIDKHVAEVRAEADADRREFEVMSAWRARERAKGRPEAELTWDACAVDLDLVAPGGGCDLHRLKLAGRKMVEAW